MVERLQDGGEGAEAVEKAFGIAERDYPPGGGVPESAGCHSSGDYGDMLSGALAGKDRPWADAWHTGRNPGCPALYRDRNRTDAYGILAVGKRPYWRDSAVRGCLYGMHGGEGIPGA